MDDLKSRAVGGAIGIACTALVWIGQTTLANKTTAEVHGTRIAAQAQLVQRNTERVEVLERLEARSIAIQESMQRMLDRLETRSDAADARHR